MRCHQDDGHDSGLKSVHHPGPGVIDFLISPWRGTAMWRGLARAALNGPFGIALGVAVSLLVGLSIGLAVTFVIAIPAVWLTFHAAAQLGRMERSRAAALLGVNLPSPHPPLASGNWLNRLRQLVTSGSRWREIAYLAIALPVLGALGFALLMLWSASLSLIALITYVGHLPGQSADLGLFRVHPGAGAITALIVGLLGLAFLAPQATAALTALDGLVVRWLLGPHTQSEMARRVSELELSRGAAVHGAEVDRQRIERDLHDGAQQRLVALAMDLGRARERFDSDPQRARQLVDDAHEEAKAALVELRDLARGIHPAVLTDRGLDAALSAVVTRCPIPVSLSVDVPGRLSAPVESAAYFVVAEALTNVAKHAKAKRAHVFIAVQNNRLVIEVRDDGIGGADASQGSGLAGLADRVAALGGWMRLLSPPKGPTSVVVELPCGS
jgi:signal transduction histidine kinase